MAGARKRFSLAETVRILQDSDVESFEEDDSDRDSNYRPSESESECDDDQDSDSDQGQTVATASDCDRDAETAASSVTSTDGWQTVQASYVVLDDITFTGQAEITAALSAAAAPISVYNALVTDDIVQLMVTETNRC